MNVVRQLPGTSPQRKGVNSEPPRRTPTTKDPPRHTPTTKAPECPGSKWANRGTCRESPAQPAVDTSAGCPRPPIAAGAYEVARKPLVATRLRTPERG